MTRIEDLDLATVPFANDRLRRLRARSLKVLGRTIGTVDLSRIVGTMHSDYAGLHLGRTEAGTRHVGGKHHGCGGRLPAAETRRRQRASA